MSKISKETWKTREMRNKIGVEGEKNNLGVLLIQGRNNSFDNGDRLYRREDKFENWILRHLGRLEHRREDMTGTNKCRANRRAFVSGKLSKNVEEIITEPYWELSSKRRDSCRFMIAALDAL